MKLVILGAGASYDAYKWYNDPLTQANWRPPLANDIFSNRDVFREIIKKYPGSEAASHDLSTFTDIESYLQTQHDKAEKLDALELKKELINLRFFLQEMFFSISEKLKDAGPSNLKLLINLIYDYTLRTKEDVLVVTFNYDLLFEREMGNRFGLFGKNFEMADYLKHKIKLVKPHGSCNWHTLFNQSAGPDKGGNVANYLWENNITQKELAKMLEDRYICDSPKHHSLNLTTNKIGYKFPQIHVPMKGKDGFNMPKEQEGYLIGSLPEVDEILIVGWKGNEEHFNKTLKQYLGNRPIKIQVVNGPQKESTIDPVLINLRDYINTNNYTIFNEEIQKDKLGNISEDKKQFMLNNGRGSLTAFLLNIENQLTKSIFCV